MNVNIGKNISYETIDGETIVINLDKGFYYSLTGTASQIWNLISKDSDLEKLIGCFGEGAKEDLREFFDQLQQEGLINISSGEPSSETVQNLSQSPYAKPKIDKYTDMEDLLLLDPIHETDEQGWPHQLQETH